MSVCTTYYCNVFSVRIILAQRMGIVELHPFLPKPKCSSWYRDRKVKDKIIKKIIIELLHSGSNKGHVYFRVYNMTTSI